MWMNEFEVAEAAVLFTSTGTPNLHTAAEALDGLVQWTNDHSDGWPYWAPPSKASQKLQRTLWLAKGQARNGTLRDMSNADLAAALKPVKAFLTRQGADHARVLA